MIDEGLKSELMKYASRMREMESGSKTTTTPFSYDSSE